MIADILVQDSERRDVLIVLVKGRELDAEMVSKFFDYIESESPSIPFGMIVDLGKIYIKKQGHEIRPDTYLTLETARILRHYDPEFGGVRVYHNYLTTLVETWLLDLASHRRSCNPPGAEELDSIGILSHLKGGETQRGVPLGVDSLR